MKRLVFRAGGRLVRPVVLVLAAGALVPSTAAAVSPKSYVVQLKAAPIASYKGGRAGLRATSPQATGARRLNARSSASRAYRSYLAGRQKAALGRVPGATPKVFYSYRVAFAGFAARLTQRQVAALRDAPQVANVFPNAKFKPQADPNLGDPSAVNLLLDGPTGYGDSAAYLNLPGGLWNDLGGPDHAGENVIVGDIDTGITPQHPSFAADPAAGYLGPAYGPAPARWAGTCDTGNDPIAPDPASFCNNKLIGARYFVDGFGASHVASDSFLSPRDDDGHGTHTASTAAGNFGVDPSIGGNDLGVNRISGIAPRARIAAYKICWVGGDVADGCTNSDSVAAIDQAVSDGVDVINYSVGGSTSNVLDAVEYAYLGASDAGVYVANSAGNSGPAAGTVGTPTTVPWMTSVGADNPARTFLATATITPASGPQFTIQGASVTEASPAAAPLVDGESIPAAGATADQAALCQDGSLAAAVANGKIVICKRGDNARINKSLNVKKAGGVGMILYNPNPAQDTNTDIHWVPSVHVSLADGTKAKDAANAPGGATAQISAGTAALGTPKTMAAFSSRGPQTAVPDLSKPDVSAPGVNILAGNTPNPAASTELQPGFSFQSISGTSMAAPHVAGAGALLKDLHPDWTPDRIKSALMTTADPAVFEEDGTTPATPLDTGTGEIDPNAAAHPGVVLDVSTQDYLGYVNSQAPGFFPGVAAVQPSDLNLPSIAASRVAGTFETTRTVTSVDAGTRPWTASIDVPGFDTSVTTGPGGSSAFDLAPGASQQLTIDATRAGAPLEQWAFGTLTLTSGSTTLRIPVSLKPIPVAVPQTVKVTTAKSAGSQAVPVKVGFDGTLTSLGWGLASPSTTAGQTVGNDADGAPDPNAPDANNRVYDVTVPSGAQLLSGRISNVDGGDPNSDLDLYLYRDANGDGTYAPDEQVDLSASSIATEGVTEVLPAAGKYRFVVVGYTTHSPSRYDWTTWVADDATPDDTSGGPGIAMTGDPFTVSVGDAVSPSLDWANVNPPGLYLGLATYHDSGAPSLSNVRGTSIVELTKTADATAPSPTPTASPTATATATPTAAPTATPTPAAVALKLRLLKAALTGQRRVLALKLDLSRKAGVSAKVRRNGKTVATAKARTIPAGTHSRRLRLSRTLAKGRSYRVTVTAKVASRTVSRTLTIKIKK